MTQKTPTHYDTLKVSRDAPTEVIHSAWRSLAEKHYPGNDRGSSVSGWSYINVINEAYDILSDPKRRAAYDLQLSQKEAAIEAEEKEKLLQVFTIPAPSTQQPKQEKAPSPLTSLLNWKPSIGFWAVLCMGSTAVVLWTWIIHHGQDKSLAPNHTPQYSYSVANNSRQLKQKYLASLRARIEKNGQILKSNYEIIQKRQEWLDQDNIRLYGNARVVSQNASYRGQFQQEVQYHQKIQLIQQKDQQQYEQDLQSYQRDVQLYQKALLNNK